MSTQREKPRAAPSLTATLTTAFFALSVLALLIFGGLQVFSNIQTQQQAIASQQQLIAQGAARTVSAFIQENFSVLETTVRLAQPGSASPEEQTQVLESLLGLQPAFRHLILLNAQDQALAQASRVSQAALGQFARQLTGDALVQIKQAKRYISPVYIDPDTSEPLVVMAVPATNTLGDFQGTLVVEVNLKFTWDLVDQLKVGETGLAYVVDRGGNLIAFRDTGRVLKGENVGALDEVAEFVSNSSSVDTTPYNLSIGILGTSVVGTHAPLETPDWAVMTELPWEEAYQEVIRSAGVSIVIMLAAAVLAGLLGLYMARRLAVPLIKLTETATRITGGEMELHAAVSGPSEVARLATAFNSMTQQLSSLIGGLEQRVVERTHELTDAQARTQVLLGELQEASRIARLANFELEPDTQTLIFSDRFYVLLGTTAEAEGGYWQPLAEAIQKYIHPDDAPRVLPEVQAVIESPDASLQQLEYRVIRTDGETRVMSFRFQVERDADGRPLRSKGVVQDITERKRAEEALQRLSYQHQLILGTVGDGIFSLDAEGKHTFVNPAAARMLGYEVEELIGRRSHPTWHHSKPDGTPYPDAECPIYATLHTAVVHSGEEYFWRKDGTGFSVEITSVPIREGDKIIGVVVTFHDMTERKQAETKLAKRAAELETVTHLATSIATIKDPQEMLQTVIDLVKPSFNLYHAHIYLLDEAGDTLALTVGAGEAGRTMVEQKRTIPLEREHSLVARAARTRAGVVANDVSREPDFLPNPLLPNTQAELAVPLIVGNDMLGVLDVQSDVTHHFTAEDIRVQTILAAQIATALQNARSAERSEKALHDLDTLTHRLTREGWKTYFDQANTGRLSYAFDNDQIVRLSQPDDLTAAGADAIVQPIMVRGEAIGQLVAAGAGAPEDDLTTILEAVSQGLSAHIENLRLTEQTQERAQELETLNTISQALISEPDLHKLLNVAGDIICRAFGTQAGYIALYDPKTRLFEIPFMLTKGERSSLPAVPLNQGPTAHILRTRQPLLLNRDARQRLAELGAITVGEDNYPQSWLGAPILAGKEAIGVISVQSQEQEDAFTEAELRLLSTVAANLSTAIQNARLFAQVQNRAEREALINTISQKIQGTVTVQSALQTVVQELGLALKAGRTAVTLNVAEGAVAEGAVAEGASDGHGRVNGH